MRSGSKLIEELVSNPVRFRATGGYERILDLLRAGRASGAVRMLLRDHSEVAGDVLWTIAQLDNVKAFALEAVKHLSSPDRATAAYAMEVVLRGAEDANALAAALMQLETCDTRVCEHAVRTLASEGAIRLTEILNTVGGTWRVLAEELSGGHFSRGSLEALFRLGSRAHQVIGAALVTLAFEKDAGYVRILKLSTEEWVRQYGEWLVDR